MVEYFIFNLLFKNSFHIFQSMSGGVPLHNTLITRAVLNGFPGADRPPTFLLLTLNARRKYQALCSNRDSDKSESSLRQSQ